MIAAVTVRLLKPGTFEEFRQAVQPDPWLPKLQRVLVYRNDDNPDQVLTMGLFDATAEEFDGLRDEQETLAEEDRRLQRVAAFEERVLLNGVYELADDVLPPAG